MCDIGLAAIRSQPDLLTERRRRYLPPEVPGEQPGDPREAHRTDAYIANDIRNASWRLPAPRRPFVRGHDPISVPIRKSRRVVQVAPNPQASLAGEGNEICTTGQASSRRWCRQTEQLSQAAHVEPSEHAVAQRIETQTAAGVVAPALRGHDRCETR